jgi:hypothetical protein
VVWIVMENHGYTAATSSSSAPYTVGLAGRCGLATSFKAETHPSLPNYIAMTSGSTQGITDDAGPTSHRIGAPSIFSQTAGNWRALQESMPSNCLLSNSGLYAVRHNPAVYYTGIASQCAARDVPLRATPDLSAAFTFVTPNLCNDTHSCPVSTGDAWLSAFLPKVFSSAAYQSGTTVVFLTWDEDDGGSGNHIATLVMAPQVPVGTRVSTSFTHYSMLRTTEELLGYPLLGSASSAASMRAPFGLAGSAGGTVTLNAPRLVTGSTKRVVAAGTTPAGWPATLTLTGPRGEKATTRDSNGGNINAQSACTPDPAGGLWKAVLAYTPPGGATSTKQVSGTVPCS